MNILRYGDSAALVNFEQQIDLETNAKVQALDRFLKSRFPTKILYTIPTFCSLTIGFDPRFFSFEKLKNAIDQFDGKMVEKQEYAHRLLKVPVCYEMPYSIDYQEVELQTKLSFEEVIRLHTSTVFQVFMLGFLPGFAYMGSLPKEIEVARKQTPRLKISAGSVGLAGLQTGIYPSDSPGGWQIIGRTPIKVFDAQKEQPFFFRAGDEVQFYSISKAEFERLI